MHEVARYRCLFALVCSSDFETRDFASLLFVLICPAWLVFFFLASQIVDIVLSYMVVYPK